MENIRSGMPKKDVNFDTMLIKGRIGEAIIEQLFLHHDYNVFRYGMENYIPSIMGILNRSSSVAQHISSMPDFVVHDKKTNNVYFIEVKFRHDGAFSKKDLKKNYHVDTFIILVSTNHIKCLTVKEIEAGLEINPTCKHYLGNRTEFNLNKDLIIKFCQLAGRFLDN